MRNPWFSEGDLRATLDSHAIAVLDRVQTIDPQLVRFSAESVVKELLEESMVVPLTFDWDNVTRTAPIESEIVGQQFGERVVIRGKSVTIIVPFTGDPQLLRCRASSFSVSGFPFDMQIAGSTLQLKVEARELNAAKVTSELARFRTTLEQQAAWSRADIETWAIQLQRELTARVERRRGELNELAALDEALKIPLVSTDKATRIDIPLRPKRIRAEPVKAASSNPDPRIADENYKEILAIISNLGRAQERLPKTASKFDEEELRDLILFALNANFAGAAKGEAFSGNGKTDIFLDWDGNNAFVAECKVWKGQKQFADAVDQLLSYTVWKDSKAALILFIKSGSPADIVSKAEIALSDHPRSTISRTDATSGLTHFMMKSSVDEAKLIDVAFIPFVVSVPAKSSV